MTKLWPFFTLERLGSWSRGFLLVSHSASYVATKGKCPCISQILHSLLHIRWSLLSIIYSAFSQLFLLYHFSSQNTSHIMPLSLKHNSGSKQNQHKTESKLSSSSISELATESQIPASLSQEASRILEFDLVSPVSIVTLLLKAPKFGFWVFHGVVFACSGFICPSVYPLFK